MLKEKACNIISYKIKHIIIDYIKFNYTKIEGIPVNTEIKNAVYDNAVNSSSYNIVSKWSNIETKEFIWLFFARKWKVCYNFDNLSTI